MLTLLLGTVCLLVFIAAFMGERGFCTFLVYPVTCHEVLFLAVSFIDIISDPEIICGRIWGSSAVRGSFAGLYSAIFSSFDFRLKLTD